MVFRILLTLSLIACTAVGDTPQIDSTDTHDIADSVAAVLGVGLENRLKRWPTRTIEDWLALQPGVAVAYPGSRDVFVHGARRYSNVYLINGSRIDDPFTGRLAGNIAPNAIGNISIHALATDQPQPQVAGGVIGITRKTGQEFFTGSFEYTTDRFTTGYNKDWYDFTIAGPLPFYPAATFALAAEYRNADDWRPSPIADRLFDNQDGRLPGNELEGHSVHASLNWPLHDRSRLSVAFDLTRDEYQTYAHEFYYYPEHSPRTSEALVHGQAAWRRLFDNGGLFRVALDVSSRTHNSGDGVMFDDLRAYQQATSIPIFDQFDLFRMPYPSGHEPVYDYYREYTVLTYAVSTGAELPIGRQFTLAFGAESAVMDVKNYENFRPSGGYNPYDINRFGYDSTGVSGDGAAIEGEVDDAPQPKTIEAYGAVTFRQHPVRITVAGEYKLLDLDGYVATEQLSLYKSVQAIGSLAPAQSVSKCSPSGRLDFDVSRTLRATGRFAMTYDMTGLDNFLIGPGFNYWGLLSHGGTSRGAPIGFRPQKATKADFTLAYRPQRNIALDITLFHHTYDQQLLLDYVLSTGGFVATYIPRGESTARGMEATLCLVPRPWFTAWCSYTNSKVTGTATDLDGSLLPQDSGIVMGAPAEFPVTAELPVRHEQQHKVTAVLDIHTGSHENSQLTGGKVLENLSLVVTGYWASGFHYTETHPFNPFTVLPTAGRPIGDRNDATLPDVIQLDLKLERTFAIGSYRLTPFLWIRNLLDRKNITTVYTSTGEPDNTGYLNTSAGKEASGDPDTGESFLQAYQVRQNDPTHFAPPRQIYLGLRAEF